MTYSNKFVMSVMLNGRPVHDTNHFVQIPFGSEYSLRFRNKNSRRAVVKIWIDGEEVSGNGYIVPANSYIDIKRHYNVDRAFKFVALDSDEAYDYGKNGPNHDKTKGTIEARFYLEKERPQVSAVHHYHHHTYPNYWPTTTWGSSTLIQNPNTDSITWNASGLNGLESITKNCATNCSVPPTSSDNTKRVRSQSFLRSRSVKTDVAPPVVKDGCTVEGMSTGQSFSSTYIDLEENATLLCLYLQGYDEVKQPREVEKEVQKMKDEQSVEAKRVADLEAENENLRRQLVELENQQLKKRLEELRGQ